MNVQIRITLSYFIHHIPMISTAFCACDMWSVYRVLVGRTEGKRPLGRPRRRWEDNIKLDLREIGIDGVNWIQLAQDKVL